MARVYRFDVEMIVADDDQTDPDDMVLIIEGLLNCEPGVGAQWEATHEELNPESVPKFSVMLGY